MTDQTDLPPTFICELPHQTTPELTAEEARELADDLGRDLYLAQDALAFVEECCVIADREQRQITTADVREWLKGARCGRQLTADAQAATEATATATVARVQRLLNTGPIGTCCAHLVRAALGPAKQTAPPPGPCPSCRRADQAGLAPNEQHASCVSP